MVRVIFYLLTLIFSQLLLSQQVFALSSVTATVDKNPVMMNESVILTVTADDDVNRNALDTAPLLANFIVGRTSVSSQTSIVNFSATRTTRWQVLLIPRQQGKVIIPSLTVEKIKTAPIALIVEAASVSSNTSQQAIFITNELSNNSVYVQELVTLTVKLHFSAELQRGSLTEPILAEANIEQIGEDQENTQIINGKRYRVIERTYAITPQQSGEFTLDAPMFSGDIVIPSQRRSSFMNFNNSKPVSILGEKLSLSVKPIPNAFADATIGQKQAQWLPSELLTLHEEWQPEPEKFMVGEPITRIITLTAEGLSKAQLPKIEMAVPNGLKVYPDQAELNSRLTKERLVSQKKQSFAIVATHAGTFNLPKISISWWNTVTNKYQQATLPAQTITVLPNSDSNNGSLFTDQLQSNNSNTTEIATDPSLSKSLSESSENTGNLLSSMSQWLFLILWLLTLLAWFIHVQRFKHRQSSVKLGDSAKAPNNKQIIGNKTPYLQLMAACKQNQAEQAFSLILPWVNSLSLINPPVTTLEQAIQQINHPSFTQAVNELQKYLYGQSNQLTDQWQGASFLAMLTEINKLPVATSMNEIELNPK